MAVTAARVSVATTAGGTLILDGADGNGVHAILKNATGTDDIYLGVSGVTTATGFKWSSSDGPFSIDLANDEVLYGIVGTTTQTVHVLATNE